MKFSQMATHDLQSDLDKFFEFILDPLEGGDESSTPEVINNNKIIVCELCLKLFSSQKKLSTHSSKHELVRAQKEANLNLPQPA